MAQARPITRWQVMTIGAVLGLIALLGLPSIVSRSTSSIVLYGYLLVWVMFLFVPERLYGTTIEQLEGKVLRIVEDLEVLLMSGEMGFSEAAYFQVKENLSEAKRELRQQIDLAHRRI